MDSSQTSRAAASHLARLDQTLNELQAHVKEQQALLAELQASTDPIDTEPAEDPKAHLLQLRALKTAYETVTSEEPFLPPVGSPLPALLALRSTDRCIKESKLCIEYTEVGVKELQKRLGAEQSVLRDAKLIQDGLESRISSLEIEIEAQTQKTPAQIGEEILQEMYAKKERYASDTAELITAYNDFIQDHLAAMLAAEDLGGPIVGGILDADEEMLEAGFSTQGKAKKPKQNADQSKRQRKIDELWGPPGDDEPREEWNEKTAAAQEMRDLTSRLMNSLMGLEGHELGSYVELPRESAAARFFVRAKICQFHPRDARKLRLNDFKGDIDD